MNLSCCRCQSDQLDTDELKITDGFSLTLYKCRECKTSQLLEEESYSAFIALRELIKNNKSNNNQTAV